LIGELVSPFAALAELRGLLTVYESP